MARFDRYMLSQLVMLFGFFSLVLVSVYWINRAIKLLDQIISDGQTALVFLEFSALTLPYVILVVLPISGFVAAVYVTNKMSSESEMVVMNTAGASPFRIGRPVFFFGAFVAVLVGILAHFLVPAARAELAIRSSEISRDITARFLKAGQFLHPTDEIAVYIRHITPLGELEGLFLEDARNPETVVTYTAEKALLVRSDAGPRLVMLDGLSQRFSPDNGRLNTISFDEFTFDIGALMERTQSEELDRRGLPTWVLLNPTPEDLAAANEEEADFLFEAHDRFARSLLAMVAPMIGFAVLMIGTFSRFGVWRQIVLAVVLIIFVQMLANWAEDVARSDPKLFLLTYLAPLVGALITCAMLLIAAANKLRPRMAAQVPA